MTPTPDEIALKPCPFCGSLAAYNEKTVAGAPYYFIDCSICDCQSGVSNRDKRTAAENWNYRPGEDDARLEGEAKGREEIERLTRERDEKAADCETHYAQEEWLRKKMQRLELDRADALTKKERLWAALKRISVMTETDHIGDEWLTPAAKIARDTLETLE